MIAKLFKRDISSAQREAIDFLKEVNLFSGLKEQELLEFVPYLYEREYEQNEVVFFRSDASQALYLVKEGTVELSLDITEGRDETLYECSKYYPLGANSLLEGQRRDFNAIVTSEKAVLIAIPQSDLLDVMQRNKNVKAKLLGKLAEIYETLFSNMFKVYRNNVGFFELNKVFEE